MLTSNAHTHMFGFKTYPINIPGPKARAAFHAAKKALAQTDSRQSSVKCITTRMLHKINVEMAQKESNSVFCVAFSNDADYLAVATANGFAQVYDHHGRFCWKIDSVDKNRWPATVCVWRPVSSAISTPDILVTGSVSGDISWWHVHSQREIYKMTEIDNQIYTLSYSPDGTRLATAGKDFTVRIYDEETKALKRAFETGVLRHTGHSSRVFASKWKVDDPNILLTGGWDNSVMIWDMRLKEVARSFYGPHIAGEALDIQNETILTGSWRTVDPIETWDFGSGKRLTSISDTSMIYTAKYLPDREGFCVAGGTGLNELRVYNLYDRMHKSAAITINDGERAGIYTCDVSDEKRPRIAVGGHSKKIQICQMGEYMSTEMATNTDPEW